MPATDSDIIFAREAADRLLRRALIDTAFRNRLKQNPDETLADAGLNAGTTEDLVREITVDGQRLSGNSKMLSACQQTCSLTCCITCIMTDPAQ
jgi:hypothetical protein